MQKKSTQKSNHRFTYNFQIIFRKLPSSVNLRISILSMKNVIWSFGGGDGGGRGLAAVMYKHRGEIDSCRLKSSILAEF